ncbi:MAG: hypothetical protein EXR39_00835 [Betaproteobacteria bacterium]|nr:hypothetical protein [Betaproteobacteria bacterium]
MRSKVFIALTLLGLSLGLASQDTAAQGHRGRVGVGVHIGVPGPFYWGPRYYYGGPGYYYPPYYYSAPIVVESPPVYVERGTTDPQAPAAQPAQPVGDWYFCSSPEGYYPYVSQCPGGWRRVPASPPAPPAPSASTPQ